MRRLTLLSPYDDSDRPLSIKLLERPRLLERIEAGILNKDRAHLICFNTTFLERNLALRLGTRSMARIHSIFLSERRVDAVNYLPAPELIILSASTT